MPNPFYAGQPDYVEKLNTLHAQVQALDAGGPSGLSGTSPPVNGSYTAGQQMTNTNIVMLGSGTDTYVVTGWVCIQSGAPGIWAEMRVPAYSGVAVPPTPTPPPTTTPPDVAGTYNAGLPTAGPANAGATGSTDASGSTTINNLITAAGVNGTVTIPGGITYTITAVITPLAGQTIQAAVGTSVTLKAGNGYAGDMVGLNTKDNVTIRNITFDGNYANRGAREGLDSAISISGCNNTNVLNCHFMQFPGFTIWTYNSQNQNYKYNTGAELYRALYYDGQNLSQSQFTFEGNSFTNTNAVKSHTGIECFNVSNFKIQHNTITGFGLLTPTSHPADGDWGMNILTHHCSGGTILNNTMNTSYWGSVFLAQATATCTFRNNYVGKGASATTRALVYSEASSDNLTCLYNVINGGVILGEAGGGNNAAFKFNTIDCDQHGIIVGGDCKVAQITDNDIESRDVTPADYGIYLLDKSSSAAVNNVDVYRNTIRKFLNAVYLGNTGGTGTTYNNDVTGNTFVSCTNGVVVQGGVTVDGTNSLQGYSTPYSSKVQAENMTNAVLSTEIPGYEGTGHADWQTGSNTLTATFSVSSTGTYDINIRYYNYGDQLNYVQVDSGSLQETQFPLSAPNWSIKTISNVSLSSGSHTVKLIYEWGYTYYDYVEVVSHSSSTPPPTPTPTPPPPTNPPTSAPYVPFGSRPDGAYAYGIKPTQTNAAMDSVVKTCYNLWKQNRLKPAPSFTPNYGVYSGQLITNAYFVDSNSIYISYPNVRAGCVSEGIGYGMIICVLMAGYDASAKTYFDGLLKLARGRPAYAQTAWGNGADVYLMDWRLGTDMSSQGGGWNASDGDMDIALALLMAHRQWGSSGTVNYWQEALRTITALKAANFHATAGIQYDGYRDISRSSDMMPNVFRAFKAATGDTLWDTGRTTSYSIVNTVINNYSPVAKLPPGFIWKPLTNPQPSPGNLIESSIEGIYDSNAVRDPWRWGWDFVLYGDSTWGGLATNIVTTIKGTATNDINKLSWAYNLNGSAVTGSNLYPDPTMSALTMVGGMCNATHQTWVDAAWNKLAAPGFFPTDYYNSELSLLCLLVASGNVWKPL